MTPHPSLRDRAITRRCALFSAGGVGAAAVLAACTSGGSDDAASSTPAGSSSGTSSGASSAAPTDAGSSSAAAPKVVAAVADVPVGGGAAVTVDGENVLLSQPTAGAVEGFSAVCPHQGGQVKPAGDHFMCSLHFSEFDLDGNVTKGPATSNLKPFDVSVSGTNVVEG